METSDKSFDIKLLRPTKRTVAIFTIWTAFNLFALITSYSQIEIFNSLGKPETSNFWPLESFARTEMELDPTGKQDTLTYEASPPALTLEELTPSKVKHRKKKDKTISPEIKKGQHVNFADLVDTTRPRRYIRLQRRYVPIRHFNGFFNNYDWSEFVIYVGGFIFVYVVSKLIAEPQSESTK
jgi:hypothetical protein